MAKVETYFVGEQHALLVDGSDTCSLLLRVLGEAPADYVQAKDVEAVLATNCLDERPERVEHLLLDDHQQSVLFDAIDCRLAELNHYNPLHWRQVLMLGGVARRMHSELATYRPLKGNSAGGRQPVSPLGFLKQDTDG